MENEDLFLQRYKYHIDLGGFGSRGQEALHEARVLVVGTTGPGIPVLMYLAAMGVGSLGIIANGPIALTDLQLQPLFGFNDAGKSAIYSLARHLRDLNPQGKTEIYDTFLHPDNALGIFSGYDVVVSATGNSGTSLLINDACVIGGIPFIYGTIQKYEGQVSVLNYKGGATLRCMDSSRGLKGNNEPGVLGVLPGIIGGYMAGEAVKIISCIGEVLGGKLLTVEMLTNNQQVTRITANPENLKITTLRPADYNITDDSSDPKGRAITAHQLSLKLSYQESLQLIDIRDHAQASSNYLENLLHVPAADLLSNVDKIHQDLPVILISDDGQIAKEFSGMLNEKHGFGNIYYLEGGIEALREKTDVAKP